MKLETITRNNKKIIKKTKTSGEITYTLKGAYLGIDRKTGKQVTTSITAKTLKALDRSLLQSKLEFEKNGSTKRKSLKIESFEELSEIWFSSFKTWVTSENTLNRVRGYLDTYIIPRFGDYKPDKIESSDIQIWVNQLAVNAQSSLALGKKRSEKGKAKDFGAIAHKLSDIFDFGITNFGLKSNPAQTIKIPPKPKANKERIMVLHDEDLTKWLAFLNTLSSSRGNRRFKIICDTLLCSALRINELLALTIHDLDFENSEITVNKTLMWKSANKKLGIKGQVICKQTPKTESGHRKVPIPLNTLEQLKTFHDEMNSYFDKHELPKSDLIFPTIYGNFMCDRNERATLKKRLAGIGLPDYGFHIFRHTHASIMLNAGANWKELQVRMGHKSITTTMDAYAELAPKKKAEAVNIFLEKLSLLSA
ncbi:MAG: site-specific integrase [Lactococcus lactis]|uniref:tyrosine-type recombinase/integrase n=1 Tax=Lactococcus lactis subsp. cremoris TaxID=1359 RepID=UPI0021AA548D|nr:site-specific integrase [Lactococcus cremoris]MDU1524753.1 site-specific integrase [Lactococcus lactis]MCT4462960.1 site-specific integrase [Lactococcus cremoris]MDU2184474.1 site-specific integrase [Lactococcus lactis]MDU3891342.1 site-specific integrase [Lactococcus lactis]MDU4035806.1 site-specific integrase [Lactococcus lactis]